MLEINLNNNKVVTDESLIHLKGLKYLHSISIGWTQITGSGFVHLATLPKLNQLYVPSYSTTDLGLINLTGSSVENLCLNGAKLTAAGLTHVKTLRKLNNLGLDLTSLTDDGLKYVNEIPNLATLHVAHTKITDAGLAQLKGSAKLSTLHIDVSQAKYLKALPEIRHILLHQTDPTEADLMQLQVLTWMSYIDLRFNKLSYEGVKKLSEKLPNCKIDWDGGTFPP